LADQTPDLLRYYPTTVMETGYDIHLLLGARMVMAGIHFIGTPPFETIYLMDSAGCEGREDEQIEGQCC